MTETPPEETGPAIFDARYDGTCPACHGDIALQAPVGYDPNGNLVHEACLPAVTP